MSAPTLTLKPIRQLPLQLANQIAAGEVVERPASVIKELLENSLDAGAKRIEINVQHGGVREISVRDDGTGIPAEQLMLALSRHATSKIDSTKDLANIHSLGFRGEALASIASVSRLQLISRTEEDEQAWQVNCENGEPQAPGKASHPQGSTVQMRDLFYNTPARRKFLRNEKTEFRHIDTVVRRVALSHFETAIKLTHNGRTVFQLNPANTNIERERRVAKLCGKPFMDHAVAIDFQAHGMHLQGWLTQKDFSRSSNDLQHFFVNGRMIRDRLITHAIHQVYQEHLLPGRYPGFVLHLNLDPQQVDVNVHPTKHEVRFREARLVHDFIYRCCCNGLEHSGLEQAGLAPSGLAPSGLEPSGLVPSGLVQGSEHDASKSVGSGYTSYRDASSSNGSQPATMVKEGHFDWTKLATATRPIDQIDQIDQTVATSTNNDEHPLGQPLAVLHNRYLLAQNRQGLVLVDLQQLAIKESYQTFLNNYETGEFVSQPLLMPTRLNVTSKQADLVEQQESILARMGMFMDRVGPETVMLRMMPTRLRATDPHAFIPTLLDCLASELKTLSSDTPPVDCLRLLSEQVRFDYQNENLARLEQHLRQVEALGDSSLWRELRLAEIQLLLPTDLPNQD